MAKTPYFLLIDDDEHSAHLLMRMLAAGGAPAIDWLNGAAMGEAQLRAALAGSRPLPGLVIVDLKSHSGANLEFVARMGTLLRVAGVPLAVMMPAFDGQAQAALRLAGVSGIFHRQPEHDAYRREAANIVSFWAQQQRLDAVGI